MAKTAIQEELFQFMIPRLKGKEYDEKMKLIQEMQDFLSGIKDALIAENTMITCTDCGKKTNAILWTTQDEEIRYAMNVSPNPYDHDEFEEIHANRIYGICPICGKRKMMKENILDRKPIKSFF